MAVIERNFLYILKTRQRTDHKKYSNFRVKLPKKLLFSVLYSLFGLTRSTKTRKKQILNRWICIVLQIIIENFSLNMLNCTSLPSRTLY